MLIPPCSSDHATIPQALVCSQKVVEHTTRSGAEAFAAIFKSRGIDIVVRMI
jgi:hypothetical protein